jgi:hypothetical protein
MNRLLTTPRRKPDRFGGPHVPELARLIAISPPDSVSVLIEIDKRWPGLSFRDFMAANVLAAAIALKTEGNA